jgi:hypothetical protein
MELVLDLNKRYTYAFFTRRFYRFTQIIKKIRENLHNPRHPRSIQPFLLLLYHLHRISCCRAPCLPTHCEQRHQTRHQPYARKNADTQRRLHDKRFQPELFQKKPCSNASQNEGNKEILQVTVKKFYSWGISRIIIFGKSKNFEDV